MLFCVHFIIDNMKIMLFFVYKSYCIFFTPKKQRKQSLKKKPKCIFEIKTISFHYVYVLNSVLMLILIETDPFRICTYLVDSHSTAYKKQFGESERVEKG